MRAIVYKESRQIDHPEALFEIELPEPQPGPRDLLVRVQAISVNPVDYKVRQRMPSASPRVLGWDAVGEVVAVGQSVTAFKPGDRVWYAGAFDRPGSNAEMQCVDERIVSIAPRSLSAPDAAALPLTSITAWELLFERLGIKPGKHPSGDVLLVSGAAGGVGSILLQLASRLTAATVIATAGRAESRLWVESLGAHHVVDYHEPLAPQLAKLGFPAVTHVASLTHTDQYFPQFVELIAPFGHLALIDDPPALDVSAMKFRSLSLHWEFMFSRSMFETNDMNAQGQLLRDVATLVDAGVLRTTATQQLGSINVENLRRAQAQLERGGVRGKLVLAGFDD
ncbi:MAG: zinc-binding alcohol dehydrogenase family protein [Myxococcales bacterium FL481]|nr:MAG: zinc-binding alcohol dehydrogenase family protein [Myxococcales bacterium FL481]